MSNYKLLTFDWDGTLIDSIALIVESLHAGAKALNLPLCEDQQARNIIGLKLDKGINTLYPNLTIEQLDFFRENFAQYYVEQEKALSKLYPNVIKTLEKLKENGYFLAVATGKNRRGLDRVLDSLGLKNFFDATRCSDETAGKPNPMMLNELISYFNVDKNQTLMIGDASFDLQMANNAQTDSVAVAYGAQPIEILKTYSPAGIIYQFEELYSWLINKNGENKTA